MNAKIDKMLVAGDALIAELVQMLKQDFPENPRASQWAERKVPTYLDFSSRESHGNKMFAHVSTDENGKEYVSASLNYHIYCADGSLTFHLIENCSEMVWPSCIVSLRDNYGTIVELQLGDEDELTDAQKSRAYEKAYDMVKRAIQSANERIERDNTPVSYRAPKDFLKDCANEMVADFNSMKPESMPEITCKRVTFNMRQSNPGSGYFVYNLSLYSGSRKLGIYPIELHFDGDDPEDDANWSCLDLNYDRSDTMHEFLNEAS